ncbi:MAG: DNA-binding beta-propeller fold protein YncE [Verrucomicrobiales bacterium]|jgi:DNA-binding beta-propeller fold protein YncE
MQFKLTFFVLAVIGSGFAEAADLILAEDGQAKAVIVLSEQPSAAARKGAKVLSDHLFQISGARFEVVNDSKLLPDGNYIAVGESALTRKLGVTAKNLGPGGILIRSFPNALVILGSDDATPSDPNGTHYAVTTFLEDALGCRFLWPGELGKVVPKRTSISVAPIDRTETSLLRQRKIRDMTHSDRDAKGLIRLRATEEDYHRLRAESEETESEDGGWFKWQRLGGSLGLAGGHAFGDAWEKWSEVHPEWFAMQPNGSRDQSELGPERSRFCVSNQELIEAIAKEKIEELKGGAKSAAIGPNDGGLATFCMCPECKKLDPPEGSSIKLMDASGKGDRTFFEYVSLTDRFVYFWNEIAKRVVEVHPDAWLTADAYSVYTDPPLRHKLHPNIAIRFVDIWYLDDAEHKIGRERWDAWAERASKLYFRSNLLLAARRYGTPVVYVHKLAEDFQYLAHHSMIGTDLDSCTHHWATQGLNYYVAARLHWNPDLDVDELINDYCQSGFGAAAESMKHYFLRLEELTNEIAAAEPALHPTAPFTSQIIEELGLILDEAARQARDPKTQERVRFLRRGLDYTEVHAAAYHLLAEVDGGDRKMTPELKTRIQQTLDRNWAFSREILLTDFKAVHVSRVAWGGWGNFNRLGWNEPAAPKVTNFPVLPDGLQLGGVSGVEIDKEGNVLVFHRGKDPILAFSPEGKFLRSFGNGLYDSTHFLRCDQEGNIWTTDNKNHTVVKLDATGKVLRTFGERDVAGEDADHFNRPADIAFGANGEIFVADGYGNSRIAKFDRSGKFLLAWGKKGKGDGEFDLPHAIQIDSKGLVYVGDRENDRIQVFDQDGNYLRQFGGFAPFGLYIDTDDTIYVADGRANKVLRMTLNGTVLEEWGSHGSEPGNFDMPHGIVVAADGAIYVAEINGKRIQKFVR